MIDFIATLDKDVLAKLDSYANYKRGPVGQTPTKA